MMLPLGWLINSSPVKEPKMVWKLVILLSLTISSEETISLGKFPLCLMPGRLGMEYHSYKNPIPLSSAWSIFMFLRPTELTQPHIWVLGYCWCWSQCYVIFFWFSVGMSEASLHLCHHFGNKFFFKCVSSLSIHCHLNPEGFCKIKICKM